MTINKDNQDKNDLMAEHEQSSTKSKTLIQRLTQPTTWYNNWIARKAEKMPDVILVSLGDTVYGRKRAEELKQTQLRPGVELTQIDALRVSYNLKQKIQKAKDEVKREIILGGIVSSLIGLAMGSALYVNVKSLQAQVPKTHENYVPRNQMQVGCKEQNDNVPCKTLLNYNGHSYEILKDGSGLRLEQIK